MVTNNHAALADANEVRTLISEALEEITDGKLNYGFIAEIAYFYSYALECYLHGWNESFIRAKGTFEGLYHAYVSVMCNYKYMRELNNIMRSVTTLTKEKYRYEIVKDVRRRIMALNAMYCTKDRC